MSFSLVPVTSSDIGALAQCHGQSFSEGWSEKELTTLLAMPGTQGLKIAEGDQIAGFILIRQAAEEMEVLTLAVEPNARRQGLAGRLIEAASALASQAGCTEIFLEVAEDNDRALGLYKKSGFKEVGRRRAYYARGGAANVDARVLKLQLTGCAN